MKIAILPGDGIGPEVTTQALNVLKIVCEKKNIPLSYDYGICGATAIEKVGNPYPDSTHKLCMNSDAVLFGAVGDPRFDNDPTLKIRPEQGLLAMRKKLGLFANIRPIETFSELIQKSPLKEDVVRDVDFICIRELTGGLYFGERGRSEDDFSAYDTCVYTRTEIERILNLAFQFAENRRGKVTVVDKANILSTSRLWREVAQDVSEKYPQVTVEYLFVDNASMRMIQSPQDFDVLVTENMFGDILTDEASVITGSMGMMPSASLGEYTPVFEPIHGSWPQAANKNIANPLAAILSVAMMFEYAFSQKEESLLIRNAVNASLKENIRTEDIQQKDLNPYTTTQVGEWIVDYISKQ